MARRKARPRPARDRRRSARGVGIADIPMPHGPASLHIPDGTLEALKWAALVSMLLDHVNKYLLHGQWPSLYMLGRLAMPLFAFGLMYRLAQPEAGNGGRAGRVMRRLALFGALATPPFVHLVGWWPANVLFMLLVATAVVWLHGQHTRATRLLAVAAFVLGGAFVEFWWFGLAFCLTAWAYCRRPSLARALACVLATLGLAVVNRNFGALAALPLLWMAPRVACRLGRRPWLFYVFYPAHLGVIALVGSQSS